MMLTVKTNAQTELIDITAPLERTVAASGVRQGLCLVYVPHTTAGVTLNEGADPSVARDLVEGLARLVPRRAGYRTDGRSFLLTHGIPMGRRERELHHTDYYLNLLKKLNPKSSL